MRDSTEQHLNEAPIFPIIDIWEAERIYKKIVTSYFFEDERYQCLSSEDHFISSRSIKNSKDFANWFDRFHTSSSKVINFCLNSGNIYAKQLGENLKSKLLTIDRYLLFLILTESEDGQLKTVVGTVLAVLYETPTSILMKLENN